MEPEDMAAGTGEEIGDLRAEEGIDVPGAGTEDSREGTRTDVEPDDSREGTDVETGADVDDWGTVTDVFGHMRQETQGLMKLKTQVMDKMRNMEMEDQAKMELKSAMRPQEWGLR